MPVPGGVRAGKISKPYGLKGEMNVILDPRSGNKIKVNNPLFIAIDGQRVPFFVLEIEWISNDQAIIKFEFINSIEEAKTFSGCEVYLEHAENNSSQESDHDLSKLIGFEAFDQENEFLGKVIDFVSHEFNPVLVINHKGRELLIPAATELIAHIDLQKGSIHFNLPEGITSL